MKDLQDKALAILTTAEAAGDLRGGLGAIREARGNLELLGKLTGELRERGIQPAPQNTVNVLVTSPEWLKIRNVIARALQPFPEARAAVVEALRDAELKH